MEQQSIGKQVAVGALIRIVLFFVQRLIAPSAEPQVLFTPRGLGQVVGSGFAGVVLYMLYYRIRHRKT